MLGRVTFQQAWESTVILAEGRFRAKILVLPYRSLKTNWQQKLNLDNPVGSIASAIPDTSITQYSSVDVGKALLQVFTQEYPAFHEESEDLLAEYVALLANAKVVPIQQNPLNLESVATVATNIGKTSAYALGGTVGLMAGQGTPFVLITVPLGIILVGAARTFSSWLEKHGEKLLNKFFGTTRQEEVKSGPQPKKASKKQP